MYELSSNFPYWFGDYVMLTLAYYLGNIHYIGMVMSVYNMDNPQGVTIHVGRLERDKKINKVLQRVQYLREYDKFSEFRFTKIVNERISEIECSCDVSLLCAGIGDRREIYNRLTTNSFYKALGYFNATYVRVILCYFCPPLYKFLCSIYHLFKKSNP